jgi:sulfite dehydrogenase
MNGASLPHFNGFPARIIVPGWTGTYWMKHVISITALTKPQGGFWMNPAYRVPLGKFPLTASPRRSTPPTRRSPRWWSIR